MGQTALKRLKKTEIGGRNVWVVIHTPSSFVLGTPVKARRTEVDATLSLCAHVGNHAGCGSPSVVYHIKSTSGASVQDAHTYQRDSV